MPPEFTPVGDVPSFALGLLFAGLFQIVIAALGEHGPFAILGLVCALLAALIYAAHQHIKPTSDVEEIPR